MRLYVRWIGIAAKVQGMPLATRGLLCYGAILVVACSLKAMCGILRGTKYKSFSFVLPWFLAFTMTAIGASQSTSGLTAEAWASFIFVALAHIIAVHIDAQDVEHQ